MVNASTDRSSTGGAPLVLVVDDEPGFRALLPRLIGDAGHETTVADSAEAAVIRLEQGGIGVVVADLRMPGKGGEWLVTQIQARFPSVGIVLATVSGEVPGTLSLGHGVLGYLVKPLDAAAVRALVADAMAWHRAQASAGVKAGDDPITEWFQKSKGLGVVPDRSEPEGDDK